MSYLAHHLIDRYKSSPVWLKTLVILGLVYLSHRIWTQITRTRREIQAASWILSERRKAGIPDSDKRPFKIAKAAVEANRKKIHPPSSASLLTPSLTNQPPPSLCPPSNLKPTSPALSNSGETIKSFHDNHDQISVSSHSSNKPQVQSTQDYRSNNIHPLPKTTPSSNNSSSESINLKPSPSSKPAPPASHSTATTSKEPIIGKSLQKRVAPLSTDGSDPDQPAIQEESSTKRNRKKVKTQEEPSSSQLDFEIAIPGKFTVDHPKLKTNNDGSPKKLQLRKKRILSDCVGELDNDQATRIKKGRSEKQSDPSEPLPQTPGTISQAQLLMQVGDDEEAEEEEEEDEKEEDEEKKDSDAEKYLIGNDGQKKKLVQIRLNSPESIHSPDEGAAEYRWVTRRQFQDLRQQGMLLMDDDNWEGDSTTSADSLDSSRNHLSTPSKRTSSVVLERGPIWSIEGKKSISKPSLPASQISPRPPSVSRARNSLGRIRLSLPPDPSSPLQRSRSRLLSPLKPSIG